MSENSEENASTDLTQRYNAAIRWVYELINFEKSVGRSRDFRLDRTRRLLEEVGNPHLQIPAIHIAGTKGKGSTATMVASILSTAGHKTGLFTSPHITRFEERIRIDGVEPTQAEIITLVDQLQHISQHDGGLVPTYFEAAMLMAWSHYLTNQADFAVLEVGLGGRLDATNVCSPQVCIITSISLDHTNILGETLDAIAREKAGIIKPGIPVVSGIPNEPARSVLRSVAASRNAPLYELGRDFQYEYSSGGLEKSTVTIKTPWDTYDLLKLSTLGRHQAMNAALAVTAAAIIRRDGHSIDAHQIASGLSTVRLPARVEVLSHDPVIIIDGAHNEASMTAVVDALHEMDLPRPAVAIFAVSRQKDAATMLALLLRTFDTVILTQYLENPRAVPPAELASIADGLSNTIGCDSVYRTAATPAEAWSLALSLQPSATCVTGSFFIASELRKLLVRNKNEPACK